MEKKLEQIGKRVGKRLATARQIRNMSQWKLAELIGVTQKNVSFWETGKRPIPVPYLLYICTVLDVTIDWFLKPQSELDIGEIFPELDEPLNDDTFTPITTMIGPAQLMPTT